MSAQAEIQEDSTFPTYSHQQDVKDKHEEDELWQSE